ncbi:MAG: hypothetical protein JOZ57_04185, partial [Abitibacteriaceae bacterium]|nr:hypothetical protein [Abditibacteriaceae bacterium]
MKLNAWLVGSAMTLTCGIAGAQPTAPANLITHDTFETGAGEWTAFGESAKAGITHDAANVKEGQGALEFDYELKPNQFNALINPTANGLPKNTQAFQFWIKSDYGANLTLVLQEANGGRYLAMFIAPKDTWQRVEIAPSDFVLSDNPDDPKDPDNKLDLDQVQAVAIGDVNQIFIQNPQMAQLLHVQAAPHRFYLDDFLISPQPLPEPDTAPDGMIDLDAFAHPQLSWLAVGGIQLSRVKDKILDGPALQADYRQAPQQLVVMSKSIRRGLLADKKHLTFDVASTKAATLIVQLEETGGGKYNTAIEVPANAQLQSINIDFANL